MRHGSPDARRLFDVTSASGITSFEGGGTSYNLPYSKDAALQDRTDVALVCRSLSTPNT
ncbi:hypothetical protein ACFVX3_32000 [Rhodococcus erythropolis]